MSGDFVTLSCPSCGAKLQITQDIDRFACGHCGHEHIVRRRGGIVSLAPVLERLDRVEVGTTRTAAELAIPRLEQEIKNLERELAHVQRSSAPSHGWKMSVYAGALGLLLVVFLVVTPLAAGFLLSGGPALLICGLGLILGIVFLAALIKWIQLDRRHNANFRMWQGEEMERLDNEITRKRRSLGMNRRVVDS